MPLSEHQINIAALLRPLPLFNGLEHDTLARVAQGTRVIAVRRGHVLFREGEMPTGFHLLVYGQVKLAIGSSQGAEKVIEIPGQGQVFGEAAMFLDRCYTVTAQTLEDSLLLHIAKAVILDQLDRDSRFGRRMIVGLALRLDELLGDVESYSLHSGCQRLIAYLLRDADDDGSMTVTLAVNKGVIASRLNMQQETFSRILHELSARGLVVVDGRRIHIPEVGRLRAHEG